MEDEIDLKPYLVALLQHWWMIAGAAVALALIAGIVAALRTPPYTASASLLIMASSSNVSLDGRFTSRDSTLFTTTTNQREALLALARDATLEARVAAELAATDSLSADYQPGSLLSKVNIATSGDLVRITASAATGEEAQRLAEIWGREYTRLVTETYTRDSVSLALVEQQLAEAQQRYRVAQAELEDFLARGEITAADQEVRRLSDLINGTRSTTNERFNAYLRRSNALELVLRDARLLRERVAEQATPDISLADSVAALLLRIQNLNTPSGQSILQLDSTLTANAQVTVAELDRFIAVLEDELRAVRSEAERLSKVDTEELSPAATRSLFERLAAAQVKLEQLNGHQRELVRNRDVAFSAVEVLLRRAEELRLASAAPQVSVRYLGTITNPTPVIGRQAITQAAIGALLGIVLTAGFIIAREAWIAARREQIPAPKPAGD